MQSSKSSARQRQIRSFVIAWLGVTLLLGAVTFVGIYYATGVVNADDAKVTDDNVAALPNPEVDGTPDDDFDPNQIATTPVPTADQAVMVVEEALDQDTAEEMADRAAAPQGENNPAMADDSSADAAASDSADSAADTTNADQDDGPAAAPAAQDATPVPSATPIPVSDTAFQVGIQVLPSGDPEVHKIWMGEVRDKLRLGWIKQQVRWEDIEPSPGQYNWGVLDVSLALAAEYNTKVMLSVVTAPDWARDPNNPYLADEHKEGPPVDPQTYANFLLTLLYRYPGQIHAVEVWNEMNLDREWASINGLSAENYVTLLRTAYTAIKSVDPGVIVISGALSPTGVNNGQTVYDDFVYMDMLIAAGLLDTTDCVGAHHNGINIGPNVPFNNVPNDPTATYRGPFENPDHSWSFYSTLNGYAQRIQMAGSDKKLCITEFGWPTMEGLSGSPQQGFEFANDNTLAEQAQFIDEAIQSMEDWGFVWLAWVWNLNYGAPNWDASDNNVPYGLLRPEWQTAPAYDVIAKYDFRSR